MHGERLPVIIVVAAATAWGLFWLPLRAFEESGLAAGWATLAVFATPLLVLLPVALWRASNGRQTGGAQAAAGLLVGGAVALYSESLLLTDVARALILFYVTPVWSTLLEVLLLKRPLTRARAFALLLGLAGLVTILGGRTGVPIPQNLGDAMALLSGMVWACGTLRVRTATGVGVFENLFSFFLYGSLVAVCLALLPLDAAGGPPAWETFAPLVPWLILASAAYMIPVMLGLVWGSKHMDPGRLGILLQMEAVVGIGSAALLTDEPFGTVEALGTVLVIGAGVVDVLGGRRRSRR